jgi:hypothetical protein
LSKIYNNPIFYLFSLLLKIKNIIINILISISYDDDPSDPDYTPTIQGREKIKTEFNKARKLNNQTNIQARWIGENTIEVFSCAEIPLRQLEYRPTKSTDKPILFRDKKEYSLLT